ncbi:uncharacterized protein BJ212DRAFT_960761 [Suillus subaureus]|uniref:Uncharacterized protein n=1 Tax=Suillus subaureus TaxID=48587 RepID=A0A9P7DUP1_9AGAM|nr:uncharacterized protein BJ212DRAFT_960761 [Suillus subaureus]KAG1803358.1 hypothetical protein BJ212DRAFT_960761 [Suillus subaureus]
MHSNCYRDLCYGHAARCRHYTRFRDFVKSLFHVQLRSHYLSRVWERISSLARGKRYVWFDAYAYKPAIYTITQYGAIYTSSIVVRCALHLSGSRAGVMADYVGVQLATLTPLLLIANLSLGVMHGEHNEAPDIVGPTFAQPVQVDIAEKIRTHPD